jgi:Uma2 family endonuclease
MSLTAPVATALGDPQQNGTTVENPGHWPRDLLEAYARYRGPYTVENAETILEEEPVELYNGWLVWQDMTDATERRVVANLQVMLDLSARKAGFGQALPDQLECLLDNGDVVKPDASLISWRRLEERVAPHGPRGRPTLMGGPELVVEIRSPSNRRAQERRKRAFYFANGVQIVWDVDETSQVIWVYTAEAPDAPTGYGAEDEIHCEPLLPGWRRRVADMFAQQASAEAVAGEVAVAWRAEGAAQTLRELLPLLVRTHFRTEPPADLAARLAQCNLNQLQTLQTAVTESETLDAWLALAPSPA